MGKNLGWFLIMAGLCVVDAHAVQIFAKGAISKNNLAQDNYVVNISGTAGFAFELASQLSVEVKYTNFTSLQNYYVIPNTGTLTDLYTDTNLVSAGITIEVVDDRHEFQPYIYLGVGYLVTERQSFYTALGSSFAIVERDPGKSSITGNVGLGIRIRVDKSVAIELEAVGYAANVTQPNPLIDLYGQAGLRIFL